MTNLRLILALMLIPVSGVVAASAGSSNEPTLQPVLADYCYIAGAISYGDRQLYGGGTYCVPAPGM